MKKFFILLFLVVFLSGTLFLASFIFFDKILTFSINKFTDYDIFCEKAKLQFPLGVRIDGLSLRRKNENFLIECQSAHLNIFLDKLTQDKEIFSRINLDEVSISFTKNSDDKIKEDVLTLLCKPEEIYNIVAFDLSLKNNEIQISEFTAYSENIHINGNYRGVVSTKEIFVDVKISFSPRIADDLDSVMKNSILSVDEDGWYSLIIDYRGNPDFLKALYKVSA